MTTWLLSLTAIAVIGVSLVAGYRRGGTRQIPRLIGILIGAVCARIFLQPVMNAFMEAFPQAMGRTETGYFYSTLAGGLVFVAVYIIFRFATSFIAYALRKREKSVINGIAGSVISLTTYVIFLSLFYNAMLCMSPRSALMDSMQADDGNIVEEVLMAAPAVLGTQTPEELRHSQQLEDASKIS